LFSCSPASKHEAAPPSKRKADRKWLYRDTRPVFAAPAPPALIHGLFNAAWLCHCPTNEKTNFMILRALLPFALAGATLFAAAPADARPRDREQDEAFKATQAGRFVSLRQIESRVVPQMRGFTYLGPELDPGSGRYRLKFMKGPQMVWIDVDARSGQVIGRSGF
jgi:hypothetical protein